MGSLKSEAQEYEQTKMKNIADLESVDIDNAIITEDREDKSGKAYTIRYVTIDGVDYRVPISVIASLKEILKDKPKLKTFKVRKTGKDLNTQYTIIPLN